ncbi:putrescine transport system ATP-binding protein [Tepidamorphus gemmatus]|uniref:Spermidine/putrescine import ATP-binding protein PotA n=1 Tax=Tepidamorphus gemmatus TaxID=747076 RepID=A0A4R3MEI2_9HYPH|nr:polyamine ABC transporter ATP-binding protein [Tepidamorphus gemmatus]TCT10597.1 putrescine transport system ATP-binding protein [Tepidamorphus gemmatus]
MTTESVFPDYRERPWLDPKARAFVEVDSVTRKFGDFIAVNDVSLKIFRGELFCLLGGSGCGKTTLLRMLAGFETPSSGRVLIDGQDMTSTPPYDRPVNMMFQSYALFPHMSVEQNVGYGLKHERMSRAEIADRVREMLELVKLEGYAKRKPHQLSGGQRQRVALARALAKKPKLLLLDEPLAALDKKLREKTQFELMNIQYQVGVTFIVVTHDQEEAMTLSTRIAVMDRGAILQVGTPTDIYEYPNCRFTANFIGSINLFDGVVVEVGAGRVVVRSEDLSAPLAVEHTAPVQLGAPVSVVVRPEKVAIGREAPADTAVNAVEGQVLDLGYFGDRSLYRVRLASGRIVLVSHQNVRRARDDERVVDWDDRVWLSWPARAALILTE